MNISNYTKLFKFKFTNKDAFNYIETKLKIEI